MTGNKLKLSLLLLISLICVACAEKARYDNYRLYRFHLQTEKHVELLQELEAQSDSYTFYGHAREIGQKVTVMVAAHKIAEIHDLMKRYGFEGVVLDWNLQNIMDEETKNTKPADTPGTQFDWSNYFQLSTIYNWMDDLVEKHDFLSTFTIGNSFDGVAIKGIKLSKKTGNTGVLVEGGIHAREWISPATATFILNNLIEAKTPEMIDLSANFDWYFVPVLNVDGYKYTFEKDRLWRKNIKPYGRNRGVDLNRNFDSNWNGIGSSDNSASYDFCGSSAFSEPEADALAKFIQNNAESFKIKTYIALHSFSQLLMFPFGHTTEKVANYEDLKVICNKAVASIASVHGKTYLSGSKYETIYPSSGGSIDWAYATGKIPISLTFELRGPADSSNMFILPAKEITPTGEETLAAFITILQEARSLGYYA